MPSNLEVINRIKKISGKSSSYKIGKTGQTLSKRLSSYSEYVKIEEILWSKSSAVVDSWEIGMIEHFIKSAKCKNKGIDNVPMKKSVKYILYVVYVERRKPKKK